MSSMRMDDQNATVIRLDYEDLCSGRVMIVIDRLPGSDDRMSAGDSGAVRIAPAARSAVGGRQGPPASALVDAADAITAATGYGPALYTSLVLAAWRGQEARALELMNAGIEDATAEGERRAIALAAYARAVLCNGLGRYPAALAAAQRACEDEDLSLHAWALSELVEASARSGNRDAAASALQRLEGRTRIAGAEWELAIRAQASALLSDRGQADSLFQEALARFRSSRTTLHLARAQLLYGEWLRREGRRVDAREQLRAAHETFDRLGADGFADRARRELLATGEAVRKRTAETRDDLTAQEAQVARLAADGQTNPEIGAQLFISPRTVEWHLRKVFRKLRVSSRRELRMALHGSGRSAVPASRDRMAR
jgi:DNA-binding CsgD family transcriptional regulator